MPRRKKADKEEEDIPPTEEEDMSDDDLSEEETDGEGEESEGEDEGEGEGELEIEEENILDVDDDEEDEMDQQAMTTAQKLLVQKKQAVMSQADVYRTYYTREKQTSPFITKFEKAKILSIRAQAIEKGAIPFVPIDDPNEDPYSIAKREYDIRKIPYFIVRTLPNQEKEYWRLSDFKSIVPLTSM
jgi:DNA-directed RNA polymerase I, II, and III subunit RPABC2